jgi:hypothetical protein
MKSHGEDTSDDETTSSSDNKEDDNNDVDNVNLESIFTAKEICYYKRINNFFRSCDKNIVNNMIKIINGESEISLRILDWFVTKYSKKRTECSLRKMQNSTELFDVGRSYKAQLKSFKKRYFDPFRRRKKFRYYYEDNIYIISTLGQLNFFKWAITYQIIDFVEKNLAQITKSMNISNKEEKEKKKKKEEKKEEKNEEENKEVKDNNQTTKIKKSKSDLQLNIKGYTVCNDKIVINFT